VGCRWDRREKGLGTTVAKATGGCGGGCSGDAAARPGETSSLGMPKRCRRKDRGALGGTVPAGRRNSPSGSTGNPQRRSVPHAQGGCTMMYLKVGE
jgi:hypothetical protein